jgi:hypothetical protein
MTLATSDELRSRISAHGRAGRGNPYPAELRKDVLAFVARAERMGASAAASARSIGIAALTVARWREEVGFVQVQVDAQPDQRLVVHGPCGISIEGLDLDAVAALLRKLA